MNLSPTGAAVLVAREGRRLTAYRDSVGVWTIGVGHTSAAGPPVVRPGLTLTAVECDAVFARDVEKYARTVREALPASPEPLPQHAFDALVSLCFNIGQGAFLRSGVLRRLRAGDRAGAAEAILMWNRPPEVIPRRRGEYDQFRTPYETALPRARRGDARPVPASVDRAAEASARPGARPWEPLPEPLPRSPAPPELAPARSGVLACLWAGLRGRLRGR